VTFNVDLYLAGDLVKRFTFPQGTGRRELYTSAGESIGVLVVTAHGARIELDEDAARALVQAQFEV